MQEWEERNWKGSRKSDVGPEKRIKVSKITHT